MQPARHFKVSLRRSPAGAHRMHVATLEGLNLTRMGRVVFLKDTPAIRGMLYQVVSFVTCEPFTGEVPASARKRAASRKRAA